MGNFSVNRWTRLSPRAGGIDVTHVIDLAEIPTQKALSDSNLTGAPRGEALVKMRDALAARFLPGLVLTVDGARVALGIVRSALEFAPGVADLPTARLTLELEAIVPTEGVKAVAFSDTNFEGRAGWKEVVAEAGKGATLLATDVPATDRSRKLTVYPTDPAEPPSEVTSANLRVRFGAESVRKGASPPAGEKAASNAMHLTTSMDVVVSGKRTFHDLSGLDTPVDLIGIASASTEGLITAAQVDERETHRPADVLEAVPGLLVSQHSGEGKANQYFLRGFNLDHGTDVASSVAGVPVNMPTHAHGQGYTDENFLIPELVSGIQYRKGPYYADEGDFSAAGAVNVNYVNVLEKPVVEVSTGVGGYRRGLLAGSHPLFGGALLAAVELFHNDGPWTNPDDFRKLNGLLRWSTGDDANRFSVTGIAYQGRWNATDQIARRGIEEGLYGRFDAIDPTDGGTSHRYSLSAAWERTGSDTQTKVEAYVVDYAFKLWSNFTYFLRDPVNGDQFEQEDRRVVVGAKARREWLMSLFGSDVEATAGLDLRNDNIPTLGLYDTKARDILSLVRKDQVSQTSGALYGQASVPVTPKFRAILGLRGDLYRFDVHSNIEENSGTETRGILSPKLSLVFGPFANTELYVNGGFGFHSNDGRGSSLTVDPATGEHTDRVSPLVRAKGAEIGVRSTAVKGFQTTFAAWLLDLDSELVFSGDAGITEPSRASRRIGFEWANTWNPYPWLTLDADLAYSRARFTEDDPAGNAIPGAIEGVASAGAAVSDLRGFSGSLRLRYFGPRALVEDDSVRSPASTLVNARVGYRIAANLRATVDVFNVFDSKASDIDYYYASRLPGEPAGGVSGIHFHPVERRSFRTSLSYSF